MDTVVTLWEAGLAAAARGEASAAAGWEQAAQHLLAEYPTREAIEGKDARAKVEAVLARLFLNAEEQRLFSLRGARGLDDSQQKAKTRALAKVRSRWASLVDKWLFPESARVPIDGTFWRRNAVGYGVVSEQRAPAAAAGQTASGKKRGVAAAAGDATLAAIADYGVQTPVDLWAIHDRGSLTDGCGGWRQHRLVLAAPASFGKSFLARELLQFRNTQMATDPRGVGPFMPGSIVVYSGSGGAGWSDIPRKDVFEYDSELLAGKYAEWEAEALALKASGRIPPPRLFILDDLASLKGVEQDPTITRMFVMGRHIGVSVILIGQSPKGLVSPIRKSNTTLYFFGTYSKEPQYNKPFAAAARVSEGVYADWCRGHLGKKNGFVFGVQPEEGVGEMELPWCLAAVSKPADADDEEDMAPPPPPPARRRAAEHLDEYDGDTVDYAAAASRVPSLGVAAAFSSLALGDKPAVPPPAVPYAAPPAVPSAVPPAVPSAGRVKSVRLYDAPRVAAAGLPPIVPGVKTVGFFEAGVAVTVGEVLWDASPAAVVPDGLALCDDDADLLDL